MGGKNSAPAPPDYTPLIFAQQQNAQQAQAMSEKAFQLGEDQLGFQREAYNRAAAQGDAYFNTYKDSLAKNQALFDQIWPGIKQEMDIQNQTAVKGQTYLDEQIAAAKTARDRSQYLWDYYTGPGGPQSIQKKLLGVADTYLTPARYEEDSARAKGDVATAFDIARANTDAQLEGYGIRPGTGRGDAYRRAEEIGRAAALSSAGTQARIGTEARGLALMDTASQVAQGLPGQVAQALSLTGTLGSSGFGAAQNAGVPGASLGLSGVGTQNTIAPSSSYAQLALNPFVNSIGPFGASGTGLVGTGGNLLGTASTALADAGSLMNTGFQNQMSQYNANYQAGSDFAGGLGSLIGGGIGLAIGGPVGGLVGSRIGGGARGFA